MLWVGALDVLGGASSFKLDGCSPRHYCDDRILKNLFGISLSLHSRQCLQGVIRTFNGLEPGRELSTLTAYTIIPTWPRVAFL